MVELRKGKKKGSSKKMEMTKALEEKTKEAEDYLNQLKYLKADFENYRKRTEKEKLEHTKYSTEKLITNLLEVLDNFERAIKAGKGKESTKETLLEGVEMTYNQLMRILEKEGLKCIKALGEPFDPYTHECVMTENSDDVDDETIIAELLKGYTLNDRVIRHSKVKIAKR